MGYVPSGPTNKGPSASRDCGSRPRCSSRVNVPPPKRYTLFAGVNVPL
jgi:hypothetical protein